MVENVRTDGERQVVALELVGNDAWQMVTDIALSTRPDVKEWQKAAFGALKPFANGGDYSIGLKIEFVVAGDCSQNIGTE